MPWRGTATVISLALALAPTCLADAHSNVTAATKAELQALEAQVKHDQHRHDMQGPLLGADVQWVGALVHAAVLAGNHSLRQPPPGAGDSGAAASVLCQPQLAGDPCACACTGLLGRLFCCALRRG
jgi:hypothetical protein